MANENDLIRRGDLKQALLKRSFFPAIVGGVLEEIPAVDAVILPKGKPGDYVLNVGDKWIPVTESLPEKYTNVLVYRPKMANKFMVSYYGYDYFCGGAMDIHGNEVITHWMPLPEPPKGE